MYRLCLLIVLLCFRFVTFGQTILSGTVIEGLTNEPLSFANVVLLHPRDSIAVVGTTADAHGEFTLRAATGSYLLWVSFIGYESHYEKIQLDKEKIKLKAIKIRPSNNELAEVEVGAAAKMFTTDFDKKVFNVENTPLAAGGSAIDLLGTLPSVQINEEGGISLRGSGDILVFINGRQTSLSASEAQSLLEKFPASAIKSVEIITNPSARYDAAGVGGIINIVLKKGQMKGLNGQVNSSVGTNHKYQAGFNLNYRTEKINYFANYSYQYRLTWGLGETDRENLNLNTSRFFLQDIHTTNYRQNHNIRLGMDYEINERSLLGVFANSALRPEARDRQYLSSFRNINLLNDSSLTRDLREDELGRNYEGGISYSYKQDKKQSFDFLVSYSLDVVDRTETFDQRFFNADNTSIPENNMFQIFDRDRQNTQGIIQLDYERNVNSDSRWDVGFKATLRDFIRPQELREARSPELPLVTNDLVTDSFFFRENVYAAYGNFRTKLGKLKIQGGLRGEYTQTRSFQPKIDSNFVNNYFNLFPSIYFDYEFAKERSLLLNYSRRISRPGIWNLGPLLNVQDPFNIRIGNPYLQPSFTDNFELGFSSKSKKFFYSATVFHRYTVNDLARVFEPFGDTAVAITWANATTRNNSGFEWVNQWSVNGQLDLNFTANLFYSSVIANTIEGMQSNDNISWTLNLIGNWRIPKIMNVQFSSNYRGPIILPQGEIAPIFYANLGLRREIWRGNGTLALSFTDMFGTQVFQIQSTTPSFSQRRMFDWETRILTLEFTYRFKGFKAKQADNKMRGGGEDMFD